MSNWDWFRRQKPDVQRDQVKGMNVERKDCAECGSKTMHSQVRGDRNNDWICQTCGSTWSDPKRRGN